MNIGILKNMRFNSRTCGVPRLNISSIEDQTFSWQDQAGVGFLAYVFMHPRTL